MLFFKDICQNSEPLGVENGKILDSQIAASSHWNDQLGSDDSKIELKASWNGGLVSGKNYVNRRIQVDFKNKAIVTNILTQRRNSTTLNQWVKSYTVYYSKDRIDFTPCQKRREVRVI